VRGFITRIGADHSDCLRAVNTICLRIVHSNILFYGKYDEVERPCESIGEHIDDRSCKNLENIVYPEWYEFLSIRRLLSSRYPKDVDPLC
jgi:hypothetical protein